MALICQETLGPPVTPPRDGVPSRSFLCSERKVGWQRQAGRRAGPPGSNLTFTKTLGCRGQSDWGQNAPRTLSPWPAAASLCCRGNDLRFGSGDVFMWATAEEDWNH
ncbi:hypothetical protein SKAU_G00030820 [Synaphobranchus kaupii]|uniref:Uncharacterized protein n=1 Tax=Synaphobranchus kaupii TaxID=118154 RepID=A0A9Q1JG30_SYNKA|nr:hypothetical protein SKAU_G00030820 [Synaphobranchus kaupii]